MCLCCHITWKKTCPQRVDQIQGSAIYQRKMVQHYLISLMLLPLLPIVRLIAPSVHQKDPSLRKKSSDKSLGMIPQMPRFVPAANVVSLILLGDIYSITHSDIGGFISCLLGQSFTICSRDSHSFKALALTLQWLQSILVSFWARISCFTIGMWFLTSIPVIVLVLIFFIFWEATFCFIQQCASTFRSSTRWILLEWLFLRVIKVATSSSATSRVSSRSVLSAMDNLVSSFECDYPLFHFIEGHISRF